MNKFGKYIFAVGAVLAAFVILFFTVKFAFTLLAVTVKTMFHSWFTVFVSGFVLMAIGFSVMVQSNKKRIETEKNQ